MSTGQETYSSAIAEARNYTAWVIEAFRPYYGRRLLEVGLGHGGYREALPTLERYVGVDIDSEAIAAVQQRHPSDRFLVGDITDAGLAATLAEERLDTVLCVNVLEHVEADEKAVETLLEVLQPGGHLLLFVPAFAAIYNDLDRMAGHVRRYRRGDLARLVPRGRGELLEGRYFNAVGGLGWWVNGFAGHGSLNDDGVNRQIEVFDRYVLPISRAVDPLVRWAFGQSLVAVVRRR